MLARLDGLESEVTSIDFDGDQVAAGGKEGEVWLWDVGSREGVMVHQHSDPCLSVQIYQNQSVVSANLAGEIRWSSASMSEPCVDVGWQIGCLQVSGSVGGRSYAIAGLVDGRVVVWSMRHLSEKAAAKQGGPPPPVPRFKQLLAFGAHSATVTCVQIVHDDVLKQDVLLTGCADGSVKSWDFAAGKEMRTFVGHRAPVTCLQFDSAKVVSGSRDSSIRVWDLRSGESLFGLFGYTSFLGSVQFNQNILVSDGTHNQVSIHDFSGASNILREGGDNNLDDDLDC